MPSENPEPVAVTREGNVAILTIQNPPFNILTTPVVDALADTVVALTRDPSVRCLIITGSGDRAFSSGANVKEMATMSAEEASRYSSKGQALTNLIERAPIPVIAAVRGFCLGGGCELALSCDFIVASEEAQFAQPEINIGVIPGWGGSRRLTRAVGVARARHWIFTGDKVPAPQARADGVVDAVVPGKKLMEESLALAAKLTSKGALAIAAAKYAVNQASDATRLLGLDYERELWGILFSSHDQKEGMGAFLDKRPANFTDKVDWKIMRGREPWRDSAEVFDQASEEVKQAVREARSDSFFPGYPMAGPEVYARIAALSVEALTTYQRLLDDTLRAAMAPYLPPDRNKGKAQV